MSRLFVVFFLIPTAFAYSSITLFFKFMSPPRVVYFIGVCVPVVLCLGAFLTLENALGIDFVIVDRLRLTRLFHKLISSFEFSFALFSFAKSRCCTLLRLLWRELNPQPCTFTLLHILISVSLDNKSLPLKLKQDLWSSGDRSRTLFGFLWSIISVELVNISVFSLKIILLILNSSPKFPRSPREPAGQKSGIMILNLFTLLFFTFYILHIPEVYQESWCASFLIR